MLAVSEYHTFFFHEISCVSRFLFISTVRLLRECFHDKGGTNSGWISTNYFNIVDSCVTGGTPLYRGTPLSFGVFLGMVGVPRVASRWLVGGTFCPRKIKIASCDLSRFL